MQMNYCRHEKNKKFRHKTDFSGNSFKEPQKIQFNMKLKWIFEVEKTWGNESGL